MKKEQNHLNAPQVYLTKQLVEILKSSSFESMKNLISYLSANRESKISERTFYRLKATLRDDYGIIIKHSRANEGYYLDQEKSMNIESFLSHMEILATAEQLSVNLIENNNTLSFVEFENKAAIDTVPNFKNVVNAIQQRLPITFNHNSFYHLKESIYTVKPYLLKQYQNRWYVIGETEKGYRTFGIDRIENIKLGTKKFKPKTEEAKDKFRNVIGLNYVDHKLEKIQLSFHPSQRPYVLSLPLHRAQKEINLEEDTSFDVELRIHPNFEFRQQILKYGSLVKVVEPEWLAEEIKEELKKGYEGYL
ncbi:MULTISPECIES: helix-turn-helix transcriptional regulator [unclassified Flavobacterium]|uniref:helix-turn-helix transcriptional regulator n=1 Tax=unclassified Flavobacterium TaxID=196869 RepID=UPI003F8F5F91